MTSGDVIELFMWGYQRHAQISLEVSAEGLFNKLDKGLNPKVFFVGVLIEDREDRHPICIEPDDTAFNVNSFSDIKGLTEELLKVDEESRIMHSHPIAQENHNNKILKRAYKNAVLKVLQRKSAYGDKEFFCCVSNSS